MNKCPICNSKVTRNKRYCTNACKQKAYRLRRNVTSTKKENIPSTEKPSKFEYEIVKVFMKEKGSYDFELPTYHEYAFVKETHPEMTKTSWLVDQIKEVKKELSHTYGYPDSTYKKAFKHYLERKLNSY